MLRKQIIKRFPASPVPNPGEIDIVAAATVLETSEQHDSPPLSRWWGRTRRLPYRGELATI